MNNFRHISKQTSQSTSRLPATPSGVTHHTAAIHNCKGSECEQQRRDSAQAQQTHEVSLSHASEIRFSMKYVAVEWLAFLFNLMEDPGSNIG